MNNIPKEKDYVYIENKRYQLYKKIKSGGEGTVYELNSNNFVAKIYHENKLNNRRKQKITALVNKNINVETISFPRSIIRNVYGEFVGFTMIKIKKTKELYSKIGQDKYEKNWDYKSLIRLCITILTQFEVLQRNNVLMGDINPQNILVENVNKVFFIDTDSYQIDGYFSEVYKPEFLSPELLQKLSIDSEYLKKNLRTKKDENYAISVILFYILFDGNYPIVKTLSNEFSYPKNVYNHADYTKVPIFCEWDWKRLNDRLRKNFYDVFKYNKEVTVFQWKKDIENFYKELNKASGEDLDIIFSKSKMIFENNKRGELEKYPPKKKKNTNKVYLIYFILIVIIFIICLKTNNKLTFLELLKNIYLSIIDDINNIL